MASIPSNPPSGYSLPPVDRWIPEEKEEKKFSASTATTNHHSSRRNVVPLDLSKVREDLKAIRNNIRAFATKYGKKSEEATDGPSGKPPISDFEKSFKPYEKLSVQGVKAYEYFSKNKDNILKLIQKFAPQCYEWADRWLNKSDNIGKWVGHAILTFFYSYKYFSISHIQQQLKKNQEVYELYTHNFIDLLKASNDEVLVVKEIQTIIAKLRSELKEQQDEALAKGIKPLGNLVFKLLVIPLEIMKVSEKIASKVSRSTHNLLKSGVELWSLHVSKSLKDKGLQHLESRVAIKIFPSPQAKSEFNTSQERLSKQEKEFMDFLKKCATIGEVRQVLGGQTHFDLPLTIEGFKRNLKNNREFRSQLLEHHLIQGGKRFVNSFQKCQTIEEVEAKLKKIGWSFNIPVDVEEFKTLVTGSSPFKDQVAVALVTCQTEEEAQARFEAIGCSFPKDKGDLKRLLDSDQDFKKELTSAFVKYLDACKTTEEAQERLRAIGCSLNIPEDIEEFKILLKGNLRFQNQLKQSYYHSKDRIVTSNDNALRESLIKKKQKRDDKIRRYRPILARHIADSQNMTFADIKTRFAHLHIVHINKEIGCIEIPNPDPTLHPTTIATIEEWNAHIQNEEFLQALAGQWVDFQETNAQLLLQATRQALLSKHHVEDKFLDFREIQHIIDIFSSVIQMAFCLCNFKSGLLSQVSYIVEILTKDIPKLGNPLLGIMYIFHPLYAKLNLRLEKFLIILAKHFFAIKYKPNEYSFESYKLEVELHLLMLMTWGHYLSFQIKKAALWLQIRLIENCVMRLKKQPLAEDERYQNMLRERTDYLRACQHPEQNPEKQIERKLNALKIKDANLIVSPGSKSADGNHQDVLQMMQEALGELNIDYFSPELREFFEDNLGFEMANNNKEQFKQHLEELLIKSEEDFIRVHASNRFHYLQGQPRQATVHNNV